LYSRAAPPASKAPTHALALVRDVILDLVKTETNSIFISVYALRDLVDHTGSHLVAELCAAYGADLSLLVVDLPCWLLIFPCWLLIFPCWLLIFPCWLLNFPCWLLMLPCWLLTCALRLLVG
jgi:hypothetical protein